MRQQPPVRLGGRDVIGEPAVADMGHRPSGIHVARVDHHEAGGMREQDAHGVMEDGVLGQMIQHVEGEREFGRGQRPQRLGRDEAPSGVARGAAGEGGGGDIDSDVLSLRLQQCQLRGIAAAQVDQAGDVVFRQEAVDHRRLEPRQAAKRSGARRAAAAVSRFPIGGGGKRVGHGDAPPEGRRSMGTERLTRD